MISKEKRKSPSARYFNLSAAKKFNLCSITVILLLTLTVYANSLTNNFTNWDDPALVIENPYIRALDFDSLLTIFTPQPGKTYQPIRVLSYAVDYYIWKLNPFGYHLGNLLLHALSAVILYLLLTNVLNRIRQEKFRESNKTIALFATLLFAVHPVNVEAVVWISARKYVLLAFFSFLAFFFYIRSTDKTRYNTLFYLFSILTYILALLSSPFSLILPCLLILYDYCCYSDIFSWTNLRKRLIYYIPLILLSVIQFFILSNVLSTGPNPTFKQHYMDNPLYTLLTMFRVLYDYLRNILLPFWLNSRYVDHISLSFFEYKIILSFCAVTFLVLLLIHQIRKGEKLTLFCIGWFLIAWFPVSNIIPISTTMADRYLYLPAVGLFLGFSLIVYKLSTRFFGHNHLPIMITSLVLVLWLSFLTVQRNKVWANSLTLWSDALRKEPNSRIAHLNLGEVLDEQGRLEEAIAHYREALRIDPDFAKGHNNLGVALVKQGKAEEAIDHLLEALRLSGHPQKKRLSLGDILDSQEKEKRQIPPDEEFPVISQVYAKSLSNLGVALALLGKFDQAVVLCKKALAIKPHSPEGLNNLGNVLAGQGKFNDAVNQYSRALELKPDYADAHNNLAVVFARLGKFAKASIHYSEALQLKPHSAEIHNNLGVALAAQGKLDDALEHYNRAVELRPEYAEAQMNLGNGLCDQGNLQRGIAHLKRALTIDSNSPEIHNNLGVALARQGKLEEAIGHFTEALRLRPSYDQAHRNLQLALDEKKKGEG